MAAYFVRGSFPTLQRRVSNRYTLAMNDDAPQTFLGVPASPAAEADVLLLPLPFEGTVSYGGGTADGPAAVWEASTQIELWDEELDFDLDGLKYFSDQPLTAHAGESPGDYLARVRAAAAELHRHRKLVIGVGGEHSLTAPLVEAAAQFGSPASIDRQPLSGVTVVQFDAHSDLRDELDGHRESHASVMRRVVEQGARVIAIGIRSAEREEFEYGRASGLVTTYFAQELAEDSDRDRALCDELAGLAGNVYLTIDIDGLDAPLCPATGTPQPGGLGWWQTLRYLRALLRTDAAKRRLIGCDLVETVPMPGTRINEFTAAKLLAKVIAYHLATV
ncbi:MAG: agmatinase [Planctomycetaceae bacterium]